MDSKERGMAKRPPPRAGQPPQEHDDLDSMLGEIAEDPAARAGYEDALRREELLAALVRARRSRSQQAVAAAMSTTQSAVSDIENGRVDPRLSTLQRYARAVEHRLEFALCAQDSAAFEFAYEPQLAKAAAAWAAQRSIAGIMADLHVHEPTSGPQSPASVAERTGLPEPTVEYDMDRLTRTGWLNSYTSPQSQEPHYSLSRSRGLALGVSVNCDHIDAVLTNLHSEPLMSLQNQLPNTSPRTVVETVADLVQELQSNVGWDQEIVGLTVTLAGRVDGSTGTVYFAPDLQTPEHSWQDIPLQADLTDAIRRQRHGRAEIQVVVENDANTLGMREDPEGERQSIAVVLLSEGGEGIGGGLVVNGGIVHGSGGVSGEIGHIVVDPGGGTCRYGTRGCLETVASAAAIVRRIQAKVAPVRDLNEAADLAARGDQKAIAVFTNAGEALGRVLSSVTAIAGPQRFVIFGPPQLTKESDLPSARAFVGGVRRAHGYYGISDVKVDIEARVLNHEVLPSAAAATAVHNFLLAPGHALSASVSPAASTRIQVGPTPPGAGLTAAAATVRSSV
jgi:predicted NBD/HSP70 family sugar kinase/transcriptional regulator with XRE-family HTH domain